MVQYNKSGKIALFDGERFTRDDKTGYYLSSRSLRQNKRVRLHVYVWEYWNGEIPAGYEVHHKDRNKNNNEITNLQLLTTEQHRRIHADDIKNSPARKAKAIINLRERALPQAIKWHKSAKGREWHTKHGKETWENRQPVIYKCTNCGKTFESLNIYNKNSNRFCSNKCKSAYRRKMKKDIEQRECIICGKPFFTNKYSKAKTCSCQCREELRCLNMQKLKASGQ